MTRGIATVGLLICAACGENAPSNPGLYYDCAAFNVGISTEQAPFDKEFAGVQLPQGFEPLSGHVDGQNAVVIACRSDYKKRQSAQ